MTGTLAHLWPTFAQVVLICPTRGRPANAARLADAWAATSVCSDLVFCIDDDDPQIGAYRALMEPVQGIIWETGPRQSMCGWTDQVACKLGDRYQAIVSIGDDHVPQTGKWDELLLDAALSTGGGIAYGDDGLQHENLPTCCLITTNITAALGAASWPPVRHRVCLPRARHMFTDAYWRDLSDAAGCRHYLPGVKVLHRHHSSKLSARDQTYADGEASWGHDEQLYRAWLAGTGAGSAPYPYSLAADVLTVKGALG